jgi:uncharacterized protein involved in outer membrane biogenesis
MSRRVRHLRRILLGAAALILLAGIAAPFVQVNRLKGRIRGELEQALHRRVEIGEVHFTLFTGPGFSVADVLIHEDPARGIEPLANVTFLEAKVSILGLLLGRFEFSTLTLVEPTVNLAKADTGWNFLSLLNDTGGSGPQQERTDLPSIQVRNGRLNFKFGDWKSPFYLGSADVDLSARAGRSGSFDIWFRGEPGRTDRPAQGYGSLTGSGEWNAARGRESELNLDLELKPSPLEEVTQLTHGRDIGLHGQIASQLNIHGPLNDLQINGQLRIEDVHRWDLVQARTGQLKVAYRGVLDWRAQKLELEASQKENPELPFVLHATASNLLVRPVWGLSMTVDQLPAASVGAVARHLGLPLPRGLDIDGKLGGRVEYASGTGWQGRMALENAAIELAGQSHLTVERAELALDNERLTLGQTPIEGQAGRSAEVQGVYEFQGKVLDVVIRGKALDLAEVQAGSGHLLSTAAVPLISNFRRGLWSGWLRYRVEADDPGEWTSSFDLWDAQVRLPGLADPLRILSAHVELNGLRVAMSRMRTRAGEIECTGEYRYEPDDNRPHRFRLSSASVDLAELERLFLPALRRDSGFLARTLRFREPKLPEWIASRHAEGTIQIESLTAGELALAGVRSRVVWDGAEIEFPNLEGRLEDGTLKAKGSIQLAGSAPKYNLRGRLQNLGWRGGKVDVEGNLASVGLGPEFLAALTSEGTFQARSVVIIGEAPVRAASGSYDFAMSRIGPKLRLTSLEASLGTERFSGQGETQTDGKLMLDLVSSSRSVRLTGPMSPLRLDFAARP